MQCIYMYLIHWRKGPNLLCITPTVTTAEGRMDYTAVKRRNRMGQKWPLFAFGDSLLRDRKLRRKESSKKKKKKR